MKRPAVGWMVASVAVAAAMVRAGTAHNATPAWRADAATREAIFRAEATTESAVRQAAARAFPGDPWSADDDFHNHEQREVRRLAASHDVGISDALRAIDEGIRNHTAPANTTPVIGTVPPCHPRPEY